MQNGIDQFVCKEGSFEVLNMISGETVLVGPNQKAVSNSSGSLLLSMAAPGDYPNEIQLNENLLQNSQNDTDDLNVRESLHPLWPRSTYSGDIVLKEHEDSAWVSKEEFKNYNLAEGDKDIISLL